MTPTREIEQVPGNPPGWITEMNPDLMQRAAEIAATLIEEGYNEEQAYEIALERLQEEGGGDETEIYEDDIFGSPV